MYIKIYTIQIYIYIDGEYKNVNIATYKILYI